MRLLAVAIVGLMVRCAGPIGPRECVLDREGILTAQQRARLDSLFSAHERRTGNKIIVVTSATFNNQNRAHFAAALGDSIRVSKDRPGNGVIITYSKARREAFITTWDGTARILHDTISQRIVDHEMIPHAKADGDYGGLWAGSVALVEFLDEPGNAIR